MASASATGAAGNVWKRALPSSVRGGSPPRSASPRIPQASHSRHPKEQEEEATSSHAGQTFAGRRYNIPTGPYCDPVDHAGQHAVGNNTRQGSDAPKNAPADYGRVEQAQNARKNDRGTYTRNKRVGSDDEPPLIISLTLDDALQSHITNLRGKYFPTARNHLQGHITLFHAIPSSNVSEVKAHIEQLCSSTAKFPVRLRPPTLSKNSKAVFAPLSANPLYNVHESLQHGFQKKLRLNLTQQDSNPKFWPHATIINKVSEEEALDAFEALQESKEVQSLAKGEALGLDLWYYRGGPWSHVRRFDFTG